MAVGWSPFGVYSDCDLETDAAFGLLRALRPVRQERRLVAGDERMRRQHRLRLQQLLGAGRTLVGFGQERVEILADRCPAHGRQRSLLAQRRQRLVRLLQIIARAAGRLRAQLHLAAGCQRRLQRPDAEIGLRGLAHAGGRRLLGPPASAFAACAHLRRAGGCFQRRRRRLAGSDARGARLGGPSGSLGGGAMPRIWRALGRSAQALSVQRHGREKDVNAFAQCCRIEAAIGRNTAYGRRAIEGS